MKKNYKNLRSYRWFAPNDIRSFGHRSRAMQIGYSKDDWYGKPIVGIINTWSDIQPCHIHFKSRVEDVKRGIFQMGGFPIELPSISLAEMYVKPTTMLYRNMLSMEVEELIRSHPIDGVVLMGGCDKTTPALLMGAISNDLPTVFLPAGPMLRGNFKGKFLGSGSDGWKYWAELRAGNISDDDWQEVETGIARSYGHCMTMGTASTMTAIAEAIGFCLPGASSIPAPDSNHIRMSSNVGKRIVEMVWQDLKPSKFVTKKSIENAIIVAMAMGCSTNAIIHLIAIARRSGIRLTMDKLDEIGRKVPVIANIRPSGKEYLMEDFYYAGGVPVVIKRLLEKKLLEENALTVNGKSIGENNKDAKCWNNEVIKEFDNPLTKNGGIKILRGNIAPNGAIIKPSAASPELMKHTGKAVVFESVEEFHEKIDDPNLEVDENSILVLKNCGPKGYPGMAEVGNMRLPQKVLKKGVRDMIRISDARMSGTAYGTVILHTAPEAAVKGPLAAVQNGDEIEVDVDQGTMNLKVDDETIKNRLENYSPVVPEITGGYQKMYVEHVMQADKGADLDFLIGKRGAEVKRHSH